MSRERRRPVNRQIIEEAAEWFVELNESEPDDTTRERFDAWLRLSPEHVRAYLKILPVWEDGSRLDAQANGNPAALLAWAKEGGNVVHLDASADSRQSPVPPASAKISSPPRRGGLRYLATAAALLAVLGALFYLQRGTYATEVGEQRIIALSDGSKIELNSRSRLKVRLGKHERSIELLEGQALFEVAKDNARPFVVRSGTAAVRAIGTQFDVYRKSSGTIVTVVEGRVSVGGPKAITRAGEVLLSAGEQIMVSDSGKPEPRPANVALATAWTQQRLMFSRTPLVEVAEEFNRYNKRQLVVRSGGAQGFNVSGTFSSTDPASLVRFLRAQAEVQIEENDSEIVVMVR